jgi:hypothetical protein
MAAFEYRQAEEIRDALTRHGVRYLFIGKSGAILLGFPETTQDADLFVEKEPDNARALVQALRTLGFGLTDREAAEIERARTSSRSGTAPSTSTSSLPPTASSPSRMPGAAA